MLEMFSNIHHKIFDKQYTVRIGMELNDHRPYILNIFGFVLLKHPVLTCYMILMTQTKIITTNWLDN